MIEIIGDLTITIVDKQLYSTNDTRVTEQVIKRRVK